MDVLYELSEHIRLKLLNNDRLVLLNLYLKKHFLNHASHAAQTFLAPTGAQGVKMCVCVCVCVTLC